MIELTVDHNGEQWVAHNEKMRLVAPTIELLDANTASLLKKQGLLEPGKTLKVCMRFDSAGLPQWVRQYAQHYFNRVVEIEA